MEIASSDAIFGNDGYVSQVIEALIDAFGEAGEAKAEFLEAIAEAVEAAQPDEEGNADPFEPPESPEPVEVTIQDPYEALGLNDFLDTADYDTNYMYQLQIPDANFGPLAGNDSLSC